MPAMVADGAPGSRTTIPPILSAAHGRCLVLPETPGVEVNPDPIQGLRELAERGVGFDMHPTMMFTTAESMYSQWLDYFTRLDSEWRQRVAAVADALSNPPADDVPGGCIYCSSSGVIEDYEGDRPCSACDGTGTPKPRGTVTPPADDVREALAKRIADEVEYRVRTAVTLAMNGREYEQHVTRGRESVAAILAEVRPRGTVTDAEVEAAWLAWDAVSVDDDPNGWLSIRAALEAAREARS